MGFDHDPAAFNTRLVLGLGFSSDAPPSRTDGAGAKTAAVPLAFEPLLTLSLSGEANNNNKASFHQGQEQAGNKKIDVNKACEDSGDVHRQASPHSAVSSFSNASVKRERDAGSEEYLEVEKVSSRASDEEEEGSNARKKLRLTKEQSALLEESFKQHSTLNPQKQKQALARELNLRPRQVEVWFQNRRARTKLKQTEVDCEFLKKCCESLTDENRRLQKELQELKALKLSQPFYMQLPAATLTMCPSCERIGGAAAAESSPSKATPLIAMAPKPHFFNPFAKPSAAC